MKNQFYDFFLILRIVSKKFFSKGEQCFETDFALNLTIFRLLVFEIWPILYSIFVVNWGLDRYLCEPDSETLTSDTR